MTFNTRKLLKRLEHYQMRINNATNAGNEKKADELQDQWDALADLVRVQVLADVQLMLDAGILTIDDDDRWQYQRVVAKVVGSLVALAWEKHT
jgi:hypothetical protein